jgi:CTP synthase
VKIIRIDSEDIEKDGPGAHLTRLDGILIPGGFGNRGTDGKILAVQFAREKKIPYFGICLGMQIATIEFARNVCKLKDAHSTEFDAKTPHPVICLLEEQEGVETMGATMRLGTWETHLTKGSLARKLYGKEVINERHRHRYEFNQGYREKMEKSGLKLSGLSPDKTLTEIVEISGHPFFVAVQFHPEFNSKPNQPHPLFSGFIAAALVHAAKRRG